MMSVRTTLKIAALRVFNVLAWCTGKRSQPTILMYHSFDEEAWRHGVAPADLEKQLEHVVKNRTVTTLSDMVAWVTGAASVPNNAIAITIDDGYADTYSVFFPLAEKYNLPFTLFLTTDLQPQPKLGNLKRPTIAELKEMHDSGLMTVGLHGHSHMNFPEVLQAGKENAEIVASKKFLEDTFGIPVTAVAYPAGRVNDAVINYCRTLGLSIGCTVALGPLRTGLDSMRLPRIIVDRQTNLSLFTERLRPGFGWYSSLVKRIK